MEHSALKVAVEKALLFLEKNELPPHWDRDSLFGNAVSSGNSDSDADLDSDVSLSQKSSLTILSAVPLLAAHIAFISEFR